VLSVPQIPAALFLKSKLAFSLFTTVTPVITVATKKKTATRLRMSINPRLKNLLFLGIKNNLVQTA
jgi:hypothetical protein